MAIVPHRCPHNAAKFEPSSQWSKEKTSALAERYGLSRTTVTKWRARTSTVEHRWRPARPQHRADFDRGSGDH
jgi:hypothetical protein